jgi:hypothetical protein
VEPASLPVTTDFLPSEDDLCARARSGTRRCADASVCRHRKSDYNYNVDDGNFNATAECAVELVYQRLCQVPARRASLPERG